MASIIKSKNTKSKKAAAFILKNNKTIVSILSKAAVAFLWLLLWQLAYLRVSSALLIPSPQMVARRLLALIETGSFWMIVGTSFVHIMSGFLFGVLMGTITAVFTSSSKIIHSILYPPLSVIRATPVASFIILALVWISSSKITGFMVFLMVLPIIWGNVHQGIGKADRNLLEMVRVFRFSRTKILVNVYIPSVLPYFLAAFTTSLGLGWKAGIAAEVLAIPKNSIGRMIYESKIYLETPDLFAWTLVIVIISIIIEKLLVQLVQKFQKRAVGR